MKKGFNSGRKVRAVVPDDGPTLTLCPPTSPSAYIQSYGGGSLRCWDCYLGEGFYCVVTAMGQELIILEDDYELVPEKYEPVMKGVNHESK